jgi:hypothetical protein
MISSPLLTVFFWRPDHILGNLVDGMNISSLYVHMLNCACSRDSSSAAHSCKSSHRRTHRNSHASASHQRAPGPPRCNRLRASVGPSLKTVGNVTDIAISSAESIRKVGLVNRAGIVGSQGWIDRRARQLIAKLLQVLLEVLGTSIDHGVDLVLNFYIR